MNIILTQSELDRIDVTPLLVSIYEVLPPGISNTTLAALRRIYLRICLGIYPGTCVAENFYLATRCTQKVFRCYELAKEHAELHFPKDLMCYIFPYSLKFIWLAPTPPSHSSPSSPPIPAKDVPPLQRIPANDSGDLFESFILVEPFNDDSDDSDDSDGSVIFVPEQSNRLSSSIPGGPRKTQKRHTLLAVPAQVL